MCRWGCRPCGCIGVSDHGILRMALLPAECSLPCVGSDALTKPDERRSWDLQCTCVCAHGNRHMPWSLARASRVSVGNSELGMLLEFHSQSAAAAMPRSGQQAGQMVRPPAQTRRPRHRRPREGGAPAAGLGSPSRRNSVLACEYTVHMPRSHGPRYMAYGSGGTTHTAASARGVCASDSQTASTGSAGCVGYPAALCVPP